MMIAAIRSPRWGSKLSVPSTRGFRPWLLTVAPLGPTVLAMSRARTGVRGITLMLLAAAFLFFGTACQETPHQVKNAVELYYGGNFPAAANTMRPLAGKKDESFVLNNCRFGSCALAAGDLPDAEEAFMEAYTVINSVKTNDGGRALGASLVFEGVKVWKGEPFERAMAFYYLGLVSLIKGDYDNARAAFNNSLFKLRDYAHDHDSTPTADKYTPYESNFALGYFGVGLCYTKMGDPQQAKANFDRAVQLQPSIAPLVQAALNPNTNTWLFVDYGQGPRRAPKGWYNEESAFGPTPAEVGPIPPTQAWVDGHAVGQDARPGVDTLAMAQDQKWQDIDTIRKTKAVLGTGAMVGGAGLAAYGADRHNTGETLAGLGIMALGAALAASSQADLRYWEMLPRTVIVVPVALNPGEHTIQVAVGGSTMAPFKVAIKPQGDNFYYIRLH
jgi:tetratricopeptide (TPR) repeat protein